MNSNELCTFQKRLLIIVPAYELLLHFRTDVPINRFFTFIIRDVDRRSMLNQHCNGFSWVVPCSPMYGCITNIISFIYIRSLLQEQSNDVSSVEICCRKECRLIKLINTINGHSFLQHAFNKTDVTFKRCIMEAVNEIIIDFYGRNS